jgi:hypothetical protein
VFDLRDGSEAGTFQAAPDTVNGCGFHPVMGLPLLATASGHRRYPLAPADSDGGSSSEEDEGEGAGPSGRRRQQQQQQQAVDGGSGGGGGKGRGGGDAGAGGAWPGLGADCNSLRLWRLQMEWVECLLPEGGDAATAEAEAGGGGADAAAAAQPGYSSIPMVRV